MTSLADGSPDGSGLCSPRDGDYNQTPRFTPWACSTSWRPGAATVLNSRSSIAGSVKLDAKATGGDYEDTRMIAPVEINFYTNAPSWSRR